MNIPSLLLNLSFQSGRLRLVETEHHYQLVAAFFGMEMVLSSMSKDDVRKRENEARRNAFKVVA